MFNMHSQCKKAWFHVNIGRTYGKGLGTHFSMEISMTVILNENNQYMYPLPLNLKKEKEEEKRNKICIS